MNNVNNYIPEYNPSKYKKAAKISKIVSIILLFIMIIGITLVLMKALLDSNSFIVNVNGISQKNWSWIIILIGSIVGVFGITSLCTYVLHIRLKQANAVFSESDEKKRLALHLKFDTEAKKAAKAHATYDAVNKVHFGEVKDVQKYIAKKQMK